MKLCLRRCLLLCLLLGPAPAWTADAAAQANGARWYAEGRRQYELGHYDQAITAFSNAFKWDRENSDALAALGHCYNSQGDTAKAQAYFQWARQVEAAKTPALPAAPPGEAAAAPAEALAPGGPAATATPVAAAAPAGIGPAGALWRSALLPGWGQVATGRGSRGYWLGGTTLALFAAGWGTYFAAESAADTYLSYGPGTSQEQFDKSYGDWETWAGANHAIVGVFAAAYALTLLDAWWGASRPPSSAALEAPRRLALAPRPLPGGAGLSLIKTF